MHEHSASRRSHLWALAICGLTVLLFGIIFWVSRRAILRDDWGARMPMGELSQFLQLLRGTCWVVIIAATSAYLLYRSSSPYRYFLCPVVSLLLWMAAVLPVLLSIR